AKAMATGDVSRAINKLDMDTVSYKEENSRIQAVVDYLKGFDVEEREKVLVVIPSNETRDKVNEEIRNLRRAEGLVVGEDVEIKGLRSASFTRVEKAD